MTYLKFPKPEPKFKLKSHTRFIAVLLIFLLIMTAVVVALGKMDQSDESKEASVAVTPFVPPPTPDPTPPPIEIPEGKVMDKVTIVIDAGHGGNDPGTTSPYEDALYEKDITLDIALQVRDLLLEKGIDVIVTRDRDMRLSNTQREDLFLRAGMANDNSAALYVSVHVNAYDLKYKGASQVKGMEVYYYNKQPVYNDFNSEQFAGIMGKTISEQNGIHYRGIIENDLSVLRNTKMPAVLIETAYITNQEDHDRLKSHEFRTNTALGITEGIMQTLDLIQAFEYEGDLYVFKEADSE